jgi:hypothetical protein
LAVKLTELALFSRNDNRDETAAWDAKENRTFALMRELEAAENRLIAAFMGEWRDRGGDPKMMRLAYSHFRKRVLQAADKRRKDRPDFGFSRFPTRR